MSRAEFVFDLFEDGFCCCSGVRGLSDGAAYYQQRGSAGYSLCWSGDSFLIFSGGSGGADAGDHEKSVGVEFFSEHGCLFRGADEAGDARGFGETAQAENLVGWRCGDADAVELFGVHAGEDGDGEEARGVGGLCGLCCGGHHGGSACGVDGEEGGSGLRDGVDGGGYGVGDVVELEVEEDVEAAIAELFDDLVASGIVELHADLEPLAGLFERVHEPESLGGGRVVEGHDEAIFWSCGEHRSSLARADWAFVAKNRNRQQQRR